MIDELYDLFLANDLSTSHDPFAEIHQMRRSIAAYPEPGCREECVQRGQRASFAVRARYVKARKRQVGVPKLLKEGSGWLEALLPPARNPGEEKIQPIAILAQGSDQDAAG